MKKDTKSRVVVTAVFAVGVTAAVLASVYSTHEYKSQEDAPVTVPSVPSLPESPVSPSIIEEAISEPIFPEALELVLPTDIPVIEVPEITVEVPEVVFDAPVVYPEPEVIHEDDPSWDCRFDGSQRCGVEIHGIWYVIQFEDGSAMSVYQR